MTIPDTLATISAEHYAMLVKYFACEPTPDIRTIMTDFMGRYQALVAREKSE